MPSDAVDLYARPEVGDADVQHALARLGGDRIGQVVDLGGTMSLNAHLVEQGLVLRVHPRFATRDRVESLREVRRRLLDHGMVVGRPVPILEDDVSEVGGRVAEVEVYVEASKPAPTLESYRWMFEAMGRLHGALDAINPEVPQPRVATWGPPSVLAEMIEVTAKAVAADSEAEALATRVRELSGLLASQWVDEDQLPTQFIHGDVRLGNVVLAPDGEAVYFDFGFAATRPRVFDLAYSLSWILLKPDASGRAEDFDWEVARDFVDSYEDGARTTLTNLERQALLPQLASVPLYLASIAGYTPDPPERIKEELPFLAIAEWVLQHRSAFG